MKLVWRITTRKSLVLDTSNEDINTKALAFLGEGF